MQADLDEFEVGKVDVEIVSVAEGVFQLPVQDRSSVDIEAAVKPEAERAPACFNPANGVLVEDDTIGGHDRLRSGAMSPGEHHDQRLVEGRIAPADMATPRSPRKRDRERRALTHPARFVSHPRAATPCGTDPHTASSGISVQNLRKAR